MYSKTIRKLHVFVSGPGDVENEKAIVGNVCDCLNRQPLAEKDIKLVPLKWPEDVVPVIAGKGPQAEIDRQIGDDYDIYVGIMWRRCGEKNENGRTPTQKEFEDALTRLKETGRPVVQFYFKRVSCPPGNDQDKYQIREVQEFQERVKGLGLYEPFTDEDDFRKKLSRWLEKIATDFDSFAAQETGVAKIPYPEPKPYLPRRTCSTKDYSAQRLPYLMEEYAGDTLDIISDCKRIVLLGDAGMGKTIELQRIASCYSQPDTPFHAFHVALNRYVNQGIAELLPEGWDAVPEGRRIVILDGLDEIEAKNKNDAIRQIELFADECPSTHIVVSCRTNFYDFETQQVSGTLSGFSSYALLELGHEEINGYVKETLKGQAKDFNVAISGNRLYELLRIPFYLVRLVELFEKNHCLPSHKAAIFQQLLEHRIQLDIQHFRTTKSLKGKQETIIEGLKRLALGMETLGRNYITDAEYTRLVEDESLRELIEHCTVWKKGESEGVRWQFEHNNFQEYLAARWLSDEPLSTVKEFMFFAPDYRRLIPSWSNALSFLISISEDRPLIQWVMDNERELCVKFEPDRIDTSTRIEIFKNIFNHYKQKRVWINHEKFRLDELARFGQSEEIVEFTLREAEQADHYTTATNALELLAHLTIPRDKKDRASRLLVNYAIRNDFGEQVQNRALMALADLGLNNSAEVVDRIVQQIKSTDNDWVRYGLYYFLHNSDYLDDNIDVFLDGLQYIRLDASPMRSRLMNELVELRRGIEKAKSAMALMKILRHFEQRAQDIGSLYAEDSIAIIAENTANAFSRDPSLFAAGRRQFEALIDAHLEKEAQQWRVFFDKTGTRLRLFEEYLSQGDSAERLPVLAILADKACLDFFVEQYNEGKLTDEAVLRFRSHLAWKNSELYLPFNNLVNEKTENKFPLPPERDYAKEKRERTQRALSLLFDKEAFLAQIKLIFDTEHKESFTSSELLDVESSCWDNLYFSDLAIGELRLLSREKVVTLAEVVAEVNGWDWEWFCIWHVYHRFHRRDDIVLTEEQKTWVGGWCYSHLRDLDFKKSLITKPNGESRTSELSVFLWHFLREFNLSYPKNVLLDMISYDWSEGGQPIGIEYLEARLSSREMTERILGNLQAGIESDNVMENHLAYCKRHAVTDVLPYASKELANRDREDSVRRLALDTICDLSPTPIPDCERALSTISDGFKWAVIEVLVQNNSHACHAHLMAILKTADEEEKIRAARYLIQLQDVEGLKYYRDWVREHKQSPEQTLHDTSCLLHLRSADALSYLVELLQMSYQLDTTENPFDSLMHNVLDAMTTIALQSDQDYTRVRGTVEQFIKANADKIKDVNFLNIFIEKLDQRHYLAKVEETSIDDAVAKIDALKR